MPAFVKTARDERLWRQARKQVSEEYPDVETGSDRYWALVNGVFQRMKYRVGGARKNPPASIPGSIEKAYEEFHGVSPESVQEGDFWVPGSMVYLGPCIDIGYRPPENSQKGQHHYVHDHKDGVKVYCRPDQVPDAEPSLYYKQFPKYIWALGVNIGFSYRDRFDGEEYEVFGNDRRKLCTDAGRKRLYVVDSKGILFMVKGGKLRVTDWIRN
jgi:hypothetical protein